MSANEAIESQSRWLLRALARLGTLVALLLGVIAIARGWPLDKTGNTFQLLGLLTASLGVPIMDPTLARTEAALSRTNHAARKWLSEQRARVARLWGRLRGRPHAVDLAATVTSGATLHAEVSVGRRSIDRDTISDRDWLGFLSDEVDAMWKRTRALEQTRTEDLAALHRRIGELDDTLRTHALSITREGWQYILSGAGLTALGIMLTLAA
jgi:hypothetical protein